MPATRVMYSGVSRVRMMPLSPLGRQYLMWLSVVYLRVCVDVCVWGGA